MANDINYWNDLEAVEKEMAKAKRKKDIKTYKYWLRELKKLVKEIKPIYPDMVEGYTKQYFNKLKLGR